MAFMDDLKTNQRTQILVGGIIFFALAFPLYFNFAASNVDEVQLSGPVGNYSVEGTYSYHQIASGSQYVNDDSTENIIANSDASMDDLKGKNLVGVRATLTFTDDETQAGSPACAFAQGPQDDDVTGGLAYAPMEESAQVNSGESVSLEWHDSSLVGTVVSNMSEADIEMMLDGMGMGEGEHTLSVSVSVNTGGGPGCASSDDGEEVAYVIELISLEYTITAVE